MRRAFPLLAVLLFLAPTAAAALPPTTGACIQLGCVRAYDADGDGDIDWVSASFTVGEQVTLNAIREEDDLLWEASVTTHELVEEPVLTASVVGGADFGDDGFERADALVYASQADHATGEETTLVREYVVLP